MNAPANPFLSALVGRWNAEPDRLFAEIWSGGERLALSWGRLGERARAYAGAYGAAGVGPGEVVFIILRHGEDLYPAFLGAMLMGAVPSLLPHPSGKQDPALYWASQTAVFARTGAKLLVTSPDLAADVTARAGLRLLCPDEVGRETGPAFPMPSDHAVALLQHSSGTTGLKKGVALSYGAIRLQLDAYAAALELEPERAVIASWLPLYHDMGLVACFLLPAYFGIPLVSLDAFEWTARPALLLEAVEAARATHVWLPNFAFAHLARGVPRGRAFDLSSLEAVIGCSEPNRPETFDRFRDRFAPEGLSSAALRTCYAMAETVFAVSQSLPGAPARRVTGTLAGARLVPGEAPGAREWMSNGPPLKDLEVRVLHAGRLHGEGIAGELCVKAPFLFEGYFADPASTAAAFTDGFYKTGDLGFLDGGELFVLGRRKDLVIVNGRNFYAHDLEAAAGTVEGLKPGRCVAFSVYLPHLGSERVVIIAEREGAMEEDARRIAEVNRALIHHFGISAGDVRIVAPGWLVKTTSGKIGRGANAAKYVETFQPSASAILDRIP